MVQSDIADRLPPWPLPLAALWATTDTRLSRQEARQIGDAGGDVRDHAPARAGVVDPPAWQVCGQIPRMKEARRQHPPDPAGLDKAADHAVTAATAQVVGRREDSARQVGSRTNSDASATVIASGISHSTRQPTAISVRA